MTFYTSFSCQFTIQSMQFISNNFSNSHTFYRSPQSAKNKWEILKESMELSVALKIFKNSEIKYLHFSKYTTKKFLLDMASLNYS